MSDRLSPQPTPLRPSRVILHCLRRPLATAVGACFLVCLMLLAFEPALLGRATQAD